MNKNDLDRLTDKTVLSVESGQRRYRRMTIKSFLEGVEIVEGIDVRLELKNSLYKHPEYIRIMTERGHLKKKRSD